MKPSSLLWRAHPTLFQVHVYMCVGVSFASRPSPLRAFYKCDCAGQKTCSVFPDPAQLKQRGRPGTEATCVCI